MSRPVSFKQFGINDRSLYRQYLDVYRAEEQLEQDEFHVFGRDLTRCWKDSRGGVAGGSLGGGRGRVGAIQRAVSWRPASGDGDVDGQARTVRSIDDLGSQSRGVSVGGRSGSDAEGGGSGSGRGDVPGGGSRCVGGAQSDGVGSEDCSVGVAEGDRVSGTESASLSGDAAVGASTVKRGKNYEKNKAKRERAKALRDAGNVPGRGKSLVSVRAAHPQLDETWAERKVRENKVAIAKLDAQLEKIEKEKRDGTAEKRYQVEANLVQGQLDGAFALVPQQRVVSWAKTINSDSSGSKSSGKKTVASIPSLSSGLGSASATPVTANERQLTEEVAKLRKQLAASDADCKKKIEKVEEVELKKRMDLSNGIERRLMFLEDEVRRRDKLVATYKSIAGIRG